MDLTSLVLISVIRSFNYYKLYDLRCTFSTVRGINKDTLVDVRQKPRYISVHENFGTASVGDNDNVLQNPAMNSTPMLKGKRRCLCLRKLC